MTPYSTSSSKVIFEVSVGRILDKNDHFILALPCAMKEYDLPEQ